MRGYRISLLLSLVVTSPAVPRPAVAQAQTTSLRWWHGAVAAGGLAALSLLDNSVRHLVQDHRSPSRDGMADAVRPFGEAEVYLGVTGGLYAAGLVSRNKRLTDAGGRLVTTFGIAALSAEAGKELLGRARPGGPFDADDFVPFSGRSSMPSGHTTVAFALATELAHDVKRPWATAGLYTLATAVGWSRLNDDQHWLSDVGAGAALGITAANLADGRWRIFHLRPPHLSLSRQRVGLSWETAL